MLLALQMKHILKMEAHLKMKAHFENENMALNKLHNFELSEPENVTEVASNCNKSGKNKNLSF